MFDEYDDYETTCQCCGKIVKRSELFDTYDCHGIFFRRVCEDCYDKVMEKGYDGQYYSELDENIDDIW